MSVFFGVLFWKSLSIDIIALVEISVWNRCRPAAPSAKRGENKFGMTTSDVTV